MQKRVFIIHGWGGKPGEHWTPWLKKELEMRGFTVIEPAMPDTDEPVIEKWVNHLSNVVGKPDEQTYFVGHSIGCQTIMRYLATLKNEEVGGVVLVAGWVKLEGELYEEGEEVVRLSQPWTQTPLDFDQIRQTTTKFTVLLSDNDPYNAVEENKKIFAEKLGAEVIVLDNKGHFTASDGVTKLPEALTTILRYAS